MNRLLINSHFSFSEEFKRKQEPKPKNEATQLVRLPRFKHQLDPQAHYPKIFGCTNFRRRESNHLMYIVIALEVRWLPVIPHNDWCNEDVYMDEMARMHKLSPKLDTISILRDKILKKWRRTLTIRRVFPKRRDSGCWSRSRVKSSRCLWSWLMIWPQYAKAIWKAFGMPKSEWYNTSQKIIFSSPRK